MRDRVGTLRQKYGRRLALPGWILTLCLPVWKVLGWLDQLDTGRWVVGEMGDLYSSAASAIPVDVWLAFLFIGGIGWLAFIGSSPPRAVDRGGVSAEATAQVRRVATIVPATVDWAGVPWKFKNRRAYPYCPGHPDVPLMFDYDGDRRDHIPHPTYPSSMRLRSFCVEGEAGHYVLFNGKSEITAAELQDEQGVADQRLTVEFRRLNPS